MAHQDARCASDAETIVVATGHTLPAVGDLTGKRLVVVRGTASGVLTWTLATQPPMSIVGQSTGTITGVGIPGPTPTPVHLTGGDVYLRNLTITGGSPGLLADGGGVVRLDHVSVVNNPGPGIRIDGSAFDIRNATVTGNGVSGGPGILLQNLSTAPAGPKSLILSTVNNNQSGVVCNTTSDVPATTSGVWPQETRHSPTSHPPAISPPAARPAPHAGRSHEVRASCVGDPPCPAWHASAHSPCPCPVPGLCLRQGGARLEQVRR